MALRAVIFDYGLVLTAQPDGEAHAAMVALTGLPVDRFERLYWADRHAYDEGRLSGVAYWEGLLREAGIGVDPERVAELNRLDARMWTTENPAMVAWQARLGEQGLATAILSNMGDAVHESVTRSFAWIERFDVLVWSYQLRMAKPDPAIYRYTLERLGRAPEETLFVDDRQVNVDAAAGLGIKAILFSTVERLREDLEAAGLDGQLPLPG